ncbi:hypothetical protein [Desulfolutivibrio sulfoxidireducens]|uniref:hypothetical protein n=1 Tax=Desulfolutivibrio sulfoxidireducens TaxID=2773299 RepID=UPI00159D4E64|nr:hypothetical protein [Desulfolutivibrio sulfoxidireducens]QLA20063.1 hypothetical protein GD604_10170 [Desulfolutivibrio sulfoxidireducens]
MIGHSGKEAGTGETWGKAWGRLLAVVMFAAMAVLPFPRAARADTDQGPPPQAPPPQTGDDEPDEEPRRDFRMGTRDNMRMGRNKEGDLIMEVEPRPRKKQDTPNTPIYVYPQIYPFSGTGSSGQGGASVQGTTSGQGTASGQGTTSGQGAAQVRQAPAMIYSPRGPGQGPGGMQPAPPGPGRGGGAGMGRGAGQVPGMPPGQSPGQPGQFPPSGTPGAPGDTPANVPNGEIGPPQTELHQTVPSTEISQPDN